MEGAAGISGLAAPSLSLAEAALPGAGAAEASGPLLCGVLAVPRRHLWATASCSFPQSSAVCARNARPKSGSAAAKLGARVAEAQVCSEIPSNCDAIRTIISDFTALVGRLVF